MPLSVCWSQTAGRRHRRFLSTRCVALGCELVPRGDSDAVVVFKTSRKHHSRAPCIARSGKPFKVYLQIATLQRSRSDLWIELHQVSQLPASLGGSSQSKHRPMNEKGSFLANCVTSAQADLNNHGTRTRATYKPSLLRAW